MRSLKYPRLLIGAAFIAAIAMPVIFFWTLTTQEKTERTTYIQTIETYSLDVSTNSPRWIKTIEKTETVRRNARDIPQKERHTTKIILPGSKVAFIEFSGGAITPNPTGVVLEVTGKNDPAPLGTYFIVDKVIIDGLHAVLATLEKSEFMEIRLQDVRADGAKLTYLKAQSVNSYPPFNPQEWNDLPGITLTNIRTDRIIIEAVNFNATVGEIRFKNISAPGKVEFSRLKGNLFTLINSTFGNGDKNPLTPALKIEEDVSVNISSETNVKSTEAIDNR